MAKAKRYMEEELRRIFDEWYEECYGYGGIQEEKCFHASCRLIEYMCRDGRERGRPEVLEGVKTKNLQPEK